MNLPDESLRGRLLPRLDIEWLPRTTKDLERQDGGARGISDSASLGQPDEALVVVRVSSLGVRLET